MIAAAAAGLLDGDDQDWLPEWRAYAEGSSRWLPHRDVAQSTRSTRSVLARTPTIFLLDSMHNARAHAVLLALWVNTQSGQQILHGA
jgi:hypothetical protein